MFRMLGFLTGVLGKGFDLFLDRGFDIDIEIGTEGRVCLGVDPVCGGGNEKGVDLGVVSSVLWSTCGHDCLEGDSVVDVEVLGEVGQDDGGAVGGNLFFHSFDHFEQGQAVHGVVGKV